MIIKKNPSVDINNLAKVDKWGKGIRRLSTKRDNLLFFFWNYSLTIMKGSQNGITTIRVLNEVIFFQCMMQLS